MKMTLRTHYLPILGYLALAFMGGCLIIAYIWLFCPYKTIEFNSDFKMAKTVYTQGEETFYTIDYCKYTDVNPVIKKKFIDGIIFTAENNSAQLAKGCRVQAVPILIPDTLPVGKYKLEVELVYKVNPVRNINIVHYSNWFTVVEKHNDLDKEEL